MSWFNPSIRLSEEMANEARKAFAVACAQLGNSMLFTLCENLVRGFFNQDHNDRTVFTKRDLTELETVISHLQDNDAKSKLTTVTEKLKKELKKTLYERLFSSMENWFKQAGSAIKAFFSSNITPKKISAVLKKCEESCYSDAENTKKFTNEKFTNALLANPALRGRFIKKSYLYLKNLPEDVKKILEASLNLEVAEFTSGKPSLFSDQNFCKTIMENNSINKTFSTLSNDLKATLSGVKIKIKLSRLSKEMNSMVPEPANEPAVTPTHTRITKELAAAQARNTYSPPLSPTNLSRSGTSTSSDSELNSDNSAATTPRSPVYDNDSKGTALGDDAARYGRIVSTPPPRPVFSC